MYICKNVKKLQVFKVKKRERERERIGIVLLFLDL